MSISMEEALGVQQQQELPKMPKTPKFTKTFLMQVMRKQLKNRTFDREAFKKEYGLNVGNGDQRVRRWLNEIAQEFEQVKTEELAILKTYCIENLTKKAVTGELESSIELRIALSGEPQELHVKQETTEKKTVNVNVKSMLADYETLFTDNEQSVGAEEKSVSENDTSEPIHSSQTDA